MNFNKNPFIGANNVSKTNSNINASATFGRVNSESIKENMLHLNASQNKQSRELVRQREEQLQKQHEAFADNQRIYNPNKAAARNAQVQAQNNIRRGFNGN